METEKVKDAAEAQATELEGKLDAAAREKKVELENQALAQATPFFNNNAGNNKTIVSTTEVVENSISKIAGGTLVESVTTTTTTTLNNGSNPAPPATPRQPLASDHPSLDLENEDIRKMTEIVRQISSPPPGEPEIQLKMVDRCGTDEEEDVSPPPTHTGQLSYVDEQQQQQV